MIKQQLMKKDPENPFFILALADVYVSLTDEEALCLAQQHNNSQITLRFGIHGHKSHIEIWYTTSVLVQKAYTCR